ncbi:unnamed protein product [Prunus brigantina]
MNSDSPCLAFALALPFGVDMLSTSIHTHPSSLLQILLEETNPSHPISASPAIVPPPPLTSHNNSHPYPISRTPIPILSVSTIPTQPPDAYPPTQPHLDLPNMRTSPTLKPSSPRPNPKHLFDWGSVKKSMMRNWFEMREREEEEMEIGFRNRLRCLTHEG